MASPATRRCRSFQASPSHCTHEWRWQGCSTQAEVGDEMGMGQAGQAIYIIYPRYWYMGLSEHVGYIPNEIAI